MIKIAYFDDFDLGDWIGIVLMNDQGKAAPTPIVYLGDEKPEMPPLKWLNTRDKRETACLHAIFSCKKTV